MGIAASLYAQTARVAIPSALLVKLMRLRVVDPLLDFFQCFPVARRVCKLAKSLTKVATRSQKQLLREVGVFVRADRRTTERCFKGVRVCNSKLSVHHYLNMRLS